LDVARPQDDGNRESEAQPKLVAKHGDGVSRVMVVTCGGSRHIVDDVRTNRFVIVVRYVVHFEFSSHKLAVRKRIRLQTIWTEQNAGARCIYPNVDDLSRIVLVSTSLAKVSAVTERIRKACPTTANILVGLAPQGWACVSPLSSRRSADTSRHRRAACTNLCARTR